jgi:fido (protein-threonine AMPylation protein)
LVETLPDGMCKAAYLMFVVSEIHPYADGNGRVARAVMNAALVAAGHVRVVIVTGYRDDYLRALKTMTQRGDPEPYVRMLVRAQRFVSELPAEDYESTKEVLHRTGALDATGDGRVRLPSEMAGRP